MNVVHGSLKGGQFTTNGVAIQTAVTGQADKAIMVFDQRIVPLHPPAKEHYLEKFTLTN